MHGYYGLCPIQKEHYILRGRWTRGVLFIGVYLLCATQYPWHFFLASCWPRSFANPGHYSVMELKLRSNKLGDFYRMSDLFNTMSHEFRPDGMAISVLDVGRRIKHQALNTKYLIRLASFHRYNFSPGATGSCTVPACRPQGCVSHCWLASTG